MDLQLKKKVALITGGSRGIGLRAARQFAEEGADVGICGRNKPDLDVAAEELRRRGVRVVAVQADMTVPDDGKRFLDECAAGLGGIDILVNNTWAISGGRLLEASDEDWRKTFEGNTFQTIRMTRLVAPFMRQRGGGVIINIASISGWVPQLMGLGQYGGAKAAIIGLTEHLALELAHDHIRVNTVSPGSILFPGGAWDEYRQQHPDSFAAYVQDGFPMGRLGTPEEIANVIAFVASPRGNWINGRHIPVDGLEQPVPTREFRVWP